MDKIILDGADFFIGSVIDLPVGDNGFLSQYSNQEKMEYIFLLESNIADDKSKEVLYSKYSQGKFCGFKITRIQKTDKFNMYGNRKVHVFGKISGTPFDVYNPYRRGKEYELEIQESNGKRFIGAQSSEHFFTFLTLHKDFENQQDIIKKYPIGSVMKIKVLNVVDSFKRINDKMISNVYYMLAQDKPVSNEILAFETDFEKGSAQAIRCLYDETFENILEKTVIPVFSKVGIYKISSQKAVIKIIEVYDENDRLIKKIEQRISFQEFQHQALNLGSRLVPDPRKLAEYAPKN